MSKPSAPTPPDFVGAANAQGQNNIDAAVAQAMLSHVNQNTPFGSISFSTSFPNGGGGGGAVGAGGLPPNVGGAPPSGPQFGHSNIDLGQGFVGAAHNQIAAGAGGSGGSGLSGLPQFTSNITLSPEMQKIFDQYMANQQAMGGVAGNLLSQAGTTLSTPFDPANLPKDSTQQAVQDALYQRSAQYLDPQFDLAQKALDAKLANQGFQINNEGYNTAQNQFGDRKQKAYADARDYAITQGVSSGLATRQQAVAEALAARNQPINELSALMGGSQVSMPQFQSFPTQGIGGAPIFDATQAQGNAALQQFGINSGIYNSQLGGLMGLGGTAILAGALCDRRLKKDIQRIGTHPRLGIGIYSFRYVSGVPAVGLMADEVESVRPDAVFEVEGYKAINYKILGNPMSSTVE